MCAPVAGMELLLVEKSINNRLCIDDLRYRWCGVQLAHGKKTPYGYQILFLETSSAAYLKQ